MKKKLWMALGLAAVLGGVGYWYVKVGQWQPGRVLDEHQGVVVYQNGLDYVKSHGRHFAEDGYYFGQKWQCVEYIKRYYYQAHGHRMPEVMGHAHSFYNASYPQGAFNVERGFFQFLQGGSELPQAEDYVVFASSSFGHVAVVTQVGENEVEVIQQNILGAPREKLRMETRDGQVFLFRAGTHAASAWLRLPKYHDEAVPEGSDYKNPKPIPHRDDPV